MATNYNDLINISTFGKKRENFDPERGELAYYCRDCQKEVSVNILNEDTMEVQCAVCSGKNVSIGTMATLREFYSKKH